MLFLMMPTGGVVSVDCSTAGTTKTGNSESVYYRIRIRTDVNGAIDDRLIAGIGLQSDATGLKNSILIVCSGMHITDVAGNRCIQTCLNRRVSLTRTDLTRRPAKSQQLSTEQKRKN